jgi:hypothetical protein
LGVAVGGGDRADRGPVRRPEPRARGRGVRAGLLAALATEVVLKNVVVCGSVNANRRHYYRAAKAKACGCR